MVFSWKINNPSYCHLQLPSIRIFWQNFHTTTIGEEELGEISTYQENLVLTDFRPFRTRLGPGGLPKYVTSGNIKTRMLFPSNSSHFNQLVHLKYSEKSVGENWRLLCGSNPEGRILAGYYGSNANILFTFQAMKNLSAYPTNVL